MSRLRMSGRQKAALAAALAVLLWLPSGVSHEEGTIITGHSTFYNGQGYDKCLGSIAGIMRTQVMWFNDQVLVERYGGKGTFIYVTQYGSADPRAKNYLYSEGVFYDFVDPNGAHWHIEEAFYAPMKVSQSGGVTPPDPQDGGFPQNGNAGTDYSVNTIDEANKTYVWFVELSANPIFDEFAGDDPHTYYNFLTVVDTCKFRRETAMNTTIRHDNASGTLNDRNGHPNGESPHSHESFLVHLWVGTRPVTVPFGSVSSNPGSWSSSWAIQYPESQAAGANHTASESVPEGFEESLP